MRSLVQPSLLLIFVFHLFLINRTTCQRDRRYLVYPPPGDNAPTKVQMTASVTFVDPQLEHDPCFRTLEHMGTSNLTRRFQIRLILGLGLPMEVDVSMIIGYVMKFNYVLPYNASYLTDSFVRYDRSIDRDDDAAEEIDLVRVDVSTSNTLDTEPSTATSRWELYEILESALESSRYGKACLLRAICEAADVPFNEMDGLTGQLLRVLLVPSSTSDTFRTHADQEYQAAELAGLRNPGQCQNIFPECPESLLEYFTEISE